MPGASQVPLRQKDPPANVGDVNLIPGSGEISWRRKWLPIPAFLLGNHVDRGAWRAAVHEGTDVPATGGQLQSGSAACSPRAGRFAWIAFSSPASNPLRCLWESSPWSHGLGHREGPLAAVSGRWSCNSEQEAWMPRSALKCLVPAEGVGIWSTVPPTLWGSQKLSSMSSAAQTCCPGSLPGVPWPSYQIGSPHPALPAVSYLCLPSTLSLACRAFPRSLGCSLERPTSRYPLDLIF